MFIETVNEDRSFDVDMRHDEYSKCDPEPSEEALIRGIGGTIIESHIELTDSLGNKRIVVKINRWSLRGLRIAPKHYLFIR